MQNFARGGFSAPQFAQAGGSSPPQDMQKRARSGFSAAQEGQVRPWAMPKIGDRVSTGDSARRGNAAALRCRPSPAPSQETNLAPHPPARSARRSLVASRSPRSRSPHAAAAAAATRIRRQVLERDLQQRPGGRRAASSTSASTSPPRAARTPAASRPASAAPSRAREGDVPSASTSTPRSTLESAAQDFSGSAGLTSTGDPAFVNFQDTDYEVPQQTLRAVRASASPSSSSRPSSRAGRRQLPHVARDRPDQLADRPLERGRRGRRGHRDDPHLRRGRRAEAGRGPARRSPRTRPRPPSR